MKFYPIILIGFLIVLCVAPVSAADYGIFSLFGIQNTDEKDAQNIEFEDLKTSIIGEWYQKKSIPFLASGEGTLLFRTDGTAKVVGTVTILGNTHNIYFDNLHWEYLDGNTFLGTYGDLQTTFTFSDGKVTASVNPYQLKIVNYRIFDFSIPVSMERVC